MKTQLILIALLTCTLAGCAEENGYREVAPPPISDPNPGTTHPSPVVIPAVTPNPSPVPVTACQAYRARDWRTTVLEDDAPSFTATFKGTDEGEVIDVNIAYDEAADYLYVQEPGTTIQSRRGDVFITTEGATHNFRQVGAITYADWFMEDDGSEDPEWFSQPSALLTPTCTTFEGSAAYKLHYFAAPIQEDWYFTPSGTLLEATYVDAAKNTDLHMTFQGVAVQRANPQGATKASFIEYSIVSEGETATGWYQNIRVEGGTFFEYYSSIDVDLYSGETLLSELKAANGYSATHGRVEFTDQGQKGILDTGDLIYLTASNAVDAYWFWNTWSQSYFEESVLEEENTSDVDPDPTTGDTIAKHYEWTYAGESYTWDMEIPVALLDYYSSLSSRTSTSARYGVHGQYVTSSLDDEHIQSLADSLLEFGQQEGFADDETLSFALAFVQSLEYTLDDVSTAYDEYPRYPLETLADETGDCEDTSILFAALSLAMGYDTVLLNPPGHIAAGVAAEAGVPGGGYMYNGKKYLFAETTIEGWEFGQVPPAYQSVNAKILTIDAGAAPVIESMTHVIEDGYYHVTLVFANDGNQDAGSGRATVYGFNAGKTYYYDSDYCTFPAFEAATQYTCDLYIQVKGTIQSLGATVRTSDGYYTQNY